MRKKIILAFIAAVLLSVGFSMFFNSSSESKKDQAPKTQEEKDRALERAIILEDSMHKAGFYLGTGNRWEMKVNGYQIYALGGCWVYFDGRHCPICPNPTCPTLRPWAMQIAACRADTLRDVIMIQNLKETAEGKVAEEDQ